MSNNSSSKPNPSHSPEKGGNWPSKNSGRPSGKGRNPGPKKR